MATDTADARLQCRSLDDLPTSWKAAIIVSAIRVMRGYGFSVNLTPGEAVDKLGISRSRAYALSSEFCRCIPIRGPGRPAKS